jgi:hypothetical protein
MRIAKKKISFIYFISDFKSVNVDKWRYIYIKYKIYEFTSEEFRHSEYLYIIGEEFKERK